MVRKTKEEAQKTREAILEAACEVFLQKGVAQATLEMIAEEAGVTRGAIYWHFKNKADIFEELHTELQQSVVEMIVQDLEKDHEHPLQQLKELCIWLLKDLKQNPKKTRVLKIFLVKCDYSGELERFLSIQNSNKQKHRALFARYFDRAKEKGFLREEADSTILATLLSCYLTGIVYEYLRNPAMIDLEIHGKCLVEEMFAGIGQYCTMRK